MDNRTLNILEWPKIKEMLKKRTIFELTKEALEMVEPETDIYMVERLQDETEASIEIMTKKGNPPFSGLKYIAKHSIDKSEKGLILSPKELLSVANVLQCARNLRNYYSEDGNKLNTVLDEFFEIITPVKDVEREIFRCIVDEETIADDATPQLKSIRREIINANSRIKEHLNNMVKSSSNQKYLQDNIVTMRDGRYVVPVKQEYRNEIQGIVHYQSATGSTLFIEPMVVVNENNNLRELSMREQEEIQRVLSFLTAKVVEDVDNIKLNLEMCVKLDCIFARGKFAMETSATRPKINNDGRINIVRARHPLIPREKVVPIDVYLGDKFNSLVITGPNTGGKTVTLKTLGLFSVMAAAGLQIPAGDGSEVAVFNKIYADIGDEQSIEQSLSTFSAHMRNIIRILKEVDNKTLVLLDEVGSGTDPIEGSAMAMAILEYLRNRGVKIAATTHYSQLKTYAISTTGVENACCEFDVETLSPTYRLLIGIPGKSNALAISKRLGLSDEVIDMAREFISEENVKFEDLISDLEYNKRLAEEERTKAELTRNELEKLREELENERSKVEEKKAKLIANAEEEAQRILFEAQSTADESLKKIRKVSKGFDEKILEMEAEEEQQKIAAKLQKVQANISKAIRAGRVNKPKTTKPFVRGEEVRIVSLNQNGVILSDVKNNTVMVQAGIMKISVDIKNLEHIEVVTKKRTSNNQALKFASQKVKSISARLDIRGTRVEEGLLEVDKYLDDACIAGLSQITIVHGKGTGALRAAIHENLKKHPHVKSFRLGEYGEGDAGITVVQIK